jgi:phenylpropionate dioxygenase-like ring-hydroxylating dioxygenase large terminal subunit
LIDEKPSPLVAGKPIPASRYSSRAFWQLEWDRIWTRVWLLAGHVARLPTSGDFFTVEIGPETLLVVRGDDGRVHAFYNVCQHRGHVLCPVDEGRVASFECPYHHWRYRLDGSLASAPGAGALPCANLDTVRLREIPCEVRLGFVWLAMTPDPEPIDAFLLPVAERIAAYGPERYRPASETTVEVACNWKTSVDVNNEGYHLRTLHAELLEVADDTTAREELLGPHSSIALPLGAAARGSPSEGTITPRLRDLMRSMGLDPTTFKGNASDVRPALALAIRARANADGVDLSALADAALVEKRQFHIFPNVQLNFTARTLEIYRHRPMGSDPLATLFDDQFYDLAPQGAPPRLRKVRRLKHGEASLGPVMGPDVDLLPHLTRGMASRGFEGLLLTERESCIAHMHRMLDAHLFGDG